jgi:hypothetical protein
VSSLAPAALLRYLAVAHYGRGRGDYAAGEHPAFWRVIVAAEVARHDLASLVALRRESGCDVDALRHAWRRELASIAVAVLATLYPDAEMPALPGHDAPGENAAGES